MFEESLSRTRRAFFGRLAALLGASELDEATWDELEALLVQADLGVETALTVTRILRQRVQVDGVTTLPSLRDSLRAVLLEVLLPSPSLRLDRSNLLNVVLIVGVNGSGKTTTMAKLALLFTRDGWRVMLAAGDTFRAAATEQLVEWGKRLHLPVIAGQSGGDPGAVAYDAIRAARARAHNLLLIDTAGRLHTKFNLMEELKKVRTVVAKNVHDAPHETWLVLDGTTGQNALVQARQFKDAAGVTGVIITKLDGTARGGVVFAIVRELGLPVRFVGVGEGLDDLLPFDAAQFVDALLEDHVHREE